MENTQNEVSFLLPLILNSDLNTTLNLIRSNEKSLQSYDVWKLKFNQDYPNKKYFDFWTSKQNYLVRYKKSFAILLNFQDDDDACDENVSNTLFEYDSMLDHLTRFFFDITAHRTWWKVTHCIFSFDVEDKVIVIHRDDACLEHLFGQYDSMKKACDDVGTQVLQLPNHHSGVFVIVNLAKMTLCFWKQEGFQNVKQERGFYKYIEYRKGRY
jgi:hypothetical protein